VQKSAGKIFAYIFSDQVGLLLIHFVWKGQTINAEFYSFLLMQLMGILRENASESALRVYCSHMDMPCLSEHLQTRRTCLPRLLIPWSPTLFPGLVSVGQPPVSWTEKSSSKSAVSLPTRSLLPRRPVCAEKVTNFWSGLQKQRAKKFIALCG